MKRAKVINSREISVDMNTRILIGSKLDSLFSHDPRNPNVSILCQEVLDLIPLDPVPPKQRLAFQFALGGIRGLFDFFKSLLPKRDTGIGLSPDEDENEDKDKKNDAVDLINTSKDYLLRAGNWKLIIDHSVIRICEFWNYDDDGNPRSDIARPVAAICYKRLPPKLQYAYHGQYAVKTLNFIFLKITVNKLERYK